MISDSHQIHHTQQNQQPTQHYANQATISGSVSSHKMDRRLFCGSDCGDREDSASVNALDDQNSNDMDPLQAQSTDQHGNDVEVLGYAEQMSEIRLQDAQCRLKESQLRCELQQLAVNRAQEELRQMREIHVLNISEMQLKLDKMKKELRMSLS